LSYRYRGSAHTFKIQDGQVADYAYHQINFEDALEWTTVVASWDDISQPSWGEPVDLNKKNIKKFAWEVIGYKNIEYQPTINFLFVDDFKCVNANSVGVHMARKSAGQLKLSVNGSTLNVTTAAAARIQVFDMQGNMVMNHLESAAGNHQVSLESLNRGNYVVRVKTVMAAQTARISIR
jgi:endoglucanase